MARRYRANVVFTPSSSTSPTPAQMIVSWISRYGPGIAAIRQEPTACPAQGKQSKVTAPKFVVAIRDRVRLHQQAALGLPVEHVERLAQPRVGEALRVIKIVVPIAGNACD